MTRRVQKLVAGFLLAFVAISVAPRLPQLVTGVVQWSGWSTAAASLAGLTLPRLDPTAMFDPAGDLPLLVAGTLTLCLLTSLTWRHVAARRAAPVSANRPIARATGTVVARQPGRAVARGARDDSLGGKIRQAALQGERAPVLAKRFGVSQDAIRAATGKSVVAGPRTSGAAQRNRPPALSTLTIARAALPAGK